MSRSRKQFLISVIYLLIFFIVGYFIYSIFKPAPTCTDQKKNQGEEKTDCGGPCAPCQKEINAQDLVVQEKYFVYGGPGRYDALIKLSNPNNQFGSPSFRYKVSLKDAQGAVIAERSRTNFILPAASKYVIETNLETASAPQSISVAVDEYKWEELTVNEAPQLNIYDKRYDLISGGTEFSEAYGLLKNESPFDFDKIIINVVLRDSSGTPLAVNSTDMRTVNSSEQRDFRLVWPFNFPGEVVSVEMVAEADVYNSQNFIKQYLPGGKFQEYQ